jgi:DNA (cytosine-5)-methyltransferase 1
VNDGIANTINTFDVGDVRTTHAVIALAENTIGRQPQNGGNGNGFTEDGPMYTLNATGVHGVSYGFEPGIAKREGEPNRFVEELTPTIRANMGDNQTAMANHMAVRRLTPIECERLQGFPDDYTNIPWRKKLESPDGPRYKAMGNSMAVPCMKWIGQRIAQIS